MHCCASTAGSFSLPTTLNSRCWPRGEPKSALIEAFCHGIRTSLMHLSGRRSVADPYYWHYVPHLSATLPKTLRDSKAFEIEWRTLLRRFLLISRTPVDISLKIRCAFARTYIPGRLRRRDHRTVIQGVIHDPRIETLSSP